MVATKTKAKPKAAEEAKGKPLLDGDLTPFIKDDKALERGLKKVEEAAKLDDSLNMHDPKDRAAVSTMWNRVGRTKVAFEKAVDEAAEPLRAELTNLKNRKEKLGERLLTLKATVRKPLVAWQEAEDARVEAINDRVREIVAMGEGLVNGQKVSWAEAKTALESGVPSADRFEEFTEAARTHRDEALAKVEHELEREAAEKKAAEELAEAQRKAAEQEKAMAAMRAEIDEANRKMEELRKAAEDKAAVELAAAEEDAKKPEPEPEPAPDYEDAEGIADRAKPAETPDSVPDDWSPEDAIDHRSNVSPLIEEIAADLQAYADVGPDEAHALAEAIYAGQIRHVGMLTTD